MKILLLMITIFVCNMSLYTNTQEINSYIDRPELLDPFLELLSEEKSPKELFAILTR